MEVVEVLRLRLAEVGDETRAAGMRRYMKSSMPFRGVNAGEVRRVCREVLAEHTLPDEKAWRAAVRELWDGAGYREERYAAIHLTGHRAYRPFQQPRNLPLYRHLVVTGAWWDLVDPVATNRVGPVLAAYRAEVTPIVRAWAVDDDLWLRRTAILCQLGHKGRTDLELLRFVVEQNLEDSVHGKQFFVRNAIGWAMREHAKADPAWVLALVGEHEERLSGLSRREALKHLA